MEDKIQEYVNRKYNTINERLNLPIIEVCNHFGMKVIGNDMAQCKNLDVSFIAGFKNNNTIIIPNKRYELKKSARIDIAYCLYCKLSGQYSKWFNTGNPFLVASEKNSVLKVNETLYKKAIELILPQDLFLDKYFFALKYKNNIVYYLSQIFSVHEDEIIKRIISLTKRDI